MGVVFTRFNPEHVEEVRRFNARLLAGGMPSQFPLSPVPAWLPPAPGRTIYQEYFVGIDEHSAVRGAYILKHQDFQIRDRVVSLGDLRLPISEGTVDRALVSVAGHLLFDALAKNPLLYGLGMGGYNGAVARWFQAARWSLSSVPFYFRVVHPLRFFRQIVHLRRTKIRRHLMDLAAWSGLGWLAVKSVQAIRGHRWRRMRNLTVEQVDEFGCWADDIWHMCRHQYGMIAVRTSEVLRVLYPADDRRLLRLKISEGNRPIGWSVLLDTQCSDHRHFGSLRLGSVVDALASVSDAQEVVRVSTKHLQVRGVDLIVSNQSHAGWCRAFEQAGYLQGPSNFLMGTSPKLTRLLRDSEVAPHDMYLNRGDGDGPIHL